MFQGYADWYQGTMRLAMLAAEAQSVVAYRLMGFAGVWSVPPSEATRMTTEKFPAFVRGWWGASRAISNGAMPGEVIGAWAQPLETTARRNRKRLGRRGFNPQPGIPPKR